MGYLTHRALVPQLAKHLGLPEGEAPRILLRAPRSDAFTHIVQCHFAGSGWDARLLYTPPPCDLLAHEANALVVLDTACGDAAATLRCLKLHPRSNPVPVLALRPRPERERALAGVRIAGDLELVEPFQMRPLLVAAEREIIRFARRPRGERRLRFLFPSRQAHLEAAAELLGRFVRPCGLGEAERVGFLAAFREAATNAVQHGNRRDAAKRVRVRARCGPGRIDVTVHDEGGGFDHAARLQQARTMEAADAARQRHRSGGQGGLGLFIIVRSTDAVAYSAAGDAVTLTKYLATPGRANAEPGQAASQAR
ncbi:MAG: ATP-binding protein [Candidatus Brocadiia bacterium]